MGLNDYILAVKAWPRRRKQIFMVVLDAVAISFSCLLVSILEPTVSDTLLAVFPFIAVGFLFLFRVNKITVSRIGYQSGLRIFAAIIVGGLVFYGLTGYERGTILYTSIAFFCVSGWRFFWGYILPEASQRYRNVSRVAIYGAGEAGIQVASSLRKSKEYEPICFFDDDIELHKQINMDLPTYHSSKIQKMILKKGLDAIILAMPSVQRSRRHEILNHLKTFNVRVQTIPGLVDIVSDKAKISDLKEVDPADLLGRDPVEADEDLLHRNVKDKVVLVTGAGGSIGSQLCREINKLGPSKLVLYEIYEYSLYKIYSELLENPNTEIIPVLGNVQDHRHIHQVIKANQIQTVYHAAAYKHVPLVETNPLEAIKNNIFGTLNTARASVENDVETFVLISTDKAVRPGNVMGATKRVAEKIIQSLSGQKTMLGGQSKTKFCFVRFGNVLDSSGSVIPLFRQQIAKGGPVTVTHKDITRYFMSIPEAVRLVLQAGALAENGDGLVLDMGDPVRIYDLAEKIIRLSGLEPKTDQNSGGDIEIKMTGLRPGEKLHEELFVHRDLAYPTNHSKILREQQSSDLDHPSFDKQIKILEKAIFKAEPLDFDKFLFDLIEAPSQEKNAA